jgi:hypothetical protein
VLAVGRVIRWSTAAAVVGVAVVAAVASYEHAYDLVRWLLRLGIAATLAMNVTHGLGHGLAGDRVAASPAVALVGSCELLMLIICNAEAQPDAALTPRVPDLDPLQVQAAQVFAGDLAASGVPSVRAIRARLHVGQQRAQRARAYLATLASS